jgi:hypothetical protein
MSSLALSIQASCLPVIPVSARKGTPHVIFLFRMGKALFGLLDYSFTLNMEGSASCTKFVSAVIFFCTVLCPLSIRWGMGEHGPKSILEGTPERWETNGQASRGDTSSHVYQDLPLLFS